MSKGQDEVLQAFVEGRSLRRSNFSTNGVAVFSYDLPICAFAGTVIVDAAARCSATTGAHINACLYRFPDAKRASEIVTGRT